MALYLTLEHAYVGGAAQAISQLKTHRLQREAKVAAAMQALPEGNLNDWLALAYADTNTRLLPIALCSLQAHVERLTALQQCSAVL